MYDASEKLNFEKAGEIKELLDYIDKVLEKIKQDPDLLQLLIATLSGD